VKLSEAIKIGRAKRPQVRGDFVKLVRLPDGSRVHGTCDLGAAYEGLTGKLPTHSKAASSNVVLEALSKELGVSKFVDLALLPDPIYKSPYERISSVVIKLNDKLKWPTEKTVAWLESIGE
jgi:hypothetical protein